MSTYTDQGIKCSLDTVRAVLKGNSAEIDFVVKNGSDADIDASAYIVDFQLSAGYGAAPLFTLTEASAKVTRSNGHIIITLDTDDLNNIGSGTYVSSLRVSPADLLKTVMLDLGSLTIKANPQTARAAEVVVTGVSGLPAVLALGVDEVANFAAIIAPTNATNQQVTWTSSDPTKATVSNGKVTGVAAGTTTITVTSVGDPTKTDTCDVTVS